MMEKLLHADALRSKSREIGFDAVGVAPAEKLTKERKRLQQWIDGGCHAGMAYMSGNMEKREDISLLVENARSVIVTLTNYYSPVRQTEGSPLIARYAYGKDYHLVVKERLRKLMRELGGIPGRCFTDSAPLFEHEWARRAGLGWIGKNTLLLHRQRGSFCFIGIIATPLPFDEYSRPFENTYCGTCTRCVDACPTGALTAYRVDARRCISYHTIESKEPFPEELREVSGNRIFGCDRCQEVCPWNGRAEQHRIPEFLPKPELLRLGGEDWRTMDESGFLRLFKDTPLERTGLEKIRSNLPVPLNSPH